MRSGVFRRPRSSHSPALDGAQPFIPLGGARYCGPPVPSVRSPFTSPCPASGTVDQEPRAFAGLLFGKRLFDAAAVLDPLAFAVFCVLSGVVYLVNDIADRTAIVCIR